MQSTASNSELSLSQETVTAVRAGDCEWAPAEVGGQSGAHGRLLTLATDSLIVALLGPLAALTFDTVQRFLFAVVILDIPIELGTYLFYQPVQAALGALKGLSVSATTLALASLYASWFIRTLVNRTPKERPRLHMNLALVVFLGITVLSVLVAQEKALSLFDVYLLLEACLIYFYVANNVRTRRDVLFVMLLLLSGCLLESLVIIAMKFTVTSTTTWDFPIHIIAENIAGDGRMRIGGTIGVPNVAGAYLSVLLASAASVLFTDLGKMYKWLATAVLGLGGVALIFTYSRGGWIALVFALVLLCFVVWRQRGASLKVPIVILTALTLLCMPFADSISIRLFGDDRGSADSRIPLNNLAFRMIGDNPLLGVGANNFTVAMDQYATSEFRREWLWAVHNKYLLVLAETGIGGLLAYLAFLLSTLRRGWRTWRLQDSAFSPLALGFVAGIAGHMVHQSVDLFRDRPLQQMVWLIAGLLVAMHRICSADQLSGKCQGGVTKSEATLRSGKLREVGA
jgi:putative inorganic carbon (hco3(-)) transporter